MRQTRRGSWKPSLESGRVPRRTNFDNPTQWADVEKLAVRKPHYTPVLWGGKRETHIAEPVKEKGKPYA